MHTVHWKKAWSVSKLIRQFWYFSNIYFSNYHYFYYRMSFPIPPSPGVSWPVHGIDFSQVTFECLPELQLDPAHWGHTSRCSRHTAIIHSFTGCLLVTRRIAGWKEKMKNLVRKVNLISLFLHAFLMCILRTAHKSFTTASELILMLNTHPWPPIHFI